ncbi:hypothetical protein [Kineococcus arenarius]|uniref:hypothetical protein n=1 Tax=Kineococcus sp. SYSU DK007 TaxID=3383128 RepID=UPI003D7F136E
MTGHGGVLHHVHLAVAVLGVVLALVAVVAHRHERWPHLVMTVAMLPGLLAGSSRAVPFAAWLAVVLGTFAAAWAGAARARRGGRSPATALELLAMAVLLLVLGPEEGSGSSTTAEAAPPSGAHVHSVPGDTAAVALVVAAAWFALAVRRCVPGPAAVAVAGRDPLVRSVCSSGMAASMLVMAAIPLVAA